MKVCAAANVAANLYHSLAIDIRDADLSRANDKCLKVDCMQEPLNGDRVRRQR